MGDTGFGIDFNWSNTNEGKEAITKLRKRFGILQSPPQLKNNATKSYIFKVLLYGKAAVGKTTLVSMLSNSPLPQIHAPTSGLTISTCYWPIKMMSTGGGVVIFKLNLWDVGSKTLGDYLDVCKESLDGILYVFSFKDKSSFLDIAKKVSMDEYITGIVLGTKFDCTDCDITMEEVKDFEKRTKVKVMMVPENAKDIDISNIFNHICSQLFSNKRTLADDVRTKYQL